MKYNSQDEARILASIYHMGRGNSFTLDEIAVNLRMSSNYVEQALNHLSEPGGPIMAFESGKYQAEHSFTDRYDRRLLKAFS